MKLVSLAVPGSFLVMLFASSFLRKTLPNHL